jgi:hypothetical protein
MPVADTDQIIPSPTTTHLGVLEVDAFCVGCHYNLHGQVVTLDDRLGIPICRCPECGRFHPAGSGVTASSIWVRRFATLLLFIWVGVALLVTIAGLFAMVGLTSGSIEPFTDSQDVTPSGKPVEYKVVNGANVMVEAGTDVVVNNSRTVWTLRPFLTAYQPDGKLNMVAPIVCATSLFMGFMAGSLCVTLLWHWPRGRYFWCLLLPLAPAAFLFLCYGQSDWYEFIRDQVFARIAGQSGLQSAGILLGVIFGRKVSRTVVRMLVPPKARQSLAFLWRVDGKPLPPAMTARAQ